MMDEIERIIQGEFCPYCNCETELVSGDKVYPQFLSTIPRPSFLDKNYYVCILNSNHYVGTYSDNVRSLGRVANAELRKLKNQGHKAFDPLWKSKRFFKSQKQAYQWLSVKMDLPIERTHFGMFTVEQCIKAIQYCHELSAKED